MNTQDIEKIIKIFESANISHLDLEIDNIKIKLNKELSSNPCVKIETVESKEKVVAETATAGNFVTSPLVGTFYQAPSADSKPFVNVGDKVKKGDKLCIIEAMKVMNEITSPYDGIIKEIFVKNESMVAYGTNLFRIEE